MQSVSERMDEIYKGWLGELRNAVSFYEYVAAKNCESPIESLFAFAAHLDALTMGDLRVVHLLDWESFDQAVRATHEPGYLLSPQVRTGAYTADFMLGLKGASGFWFAAIECDGHEFHERTKEQAAHDKRRDRELQAMGMQVLRFTGREIWRDPITCVREAKECLLELDIAEFNRSL